MFSQFSSLVPSFRSFTRQAAEHTVKVPSADIHDVETATEKPARTLKHLLRLNHVNYSVLYNERKFYNHMPHLLSTSYLFGADSDHLNRLYESESKELEEWADSPGEVCVDDWRGYLGRREYQRAYLDFFEDEVVRCGYDWKKVVEEYLFDSKTPLVNSLISGYGHPLIHLGYAYEMDNREIAMEALAMTASCYSDIHKYFDDAFYFRNASEPGFSMTSLTGILERVQDDESFKGQLKTESDTNLDTVFRTLEAPLLKHWAAWEIVNATAQFEDAQRLATALLVNSGTDSHDFFVAHLVTTTHALRVIFPEIPAQHHVTLLRQWWLLCLAVYIAESHPRFGAFSIDEIKDYDLKGRDWNWVSRCAVQNELSTSAHYIKPLRTMRDAEKTWGDKGGFYLRAAVKFIDEFKGWSGL